MSLKFEECEVCGEKAIMKHDTMLCPNCQYEIDQERNKHKHEEHSLEDCKKCPMNFMCPEYFFKQEQHNNKGNEKDDKNKRKNSGIFFRFL